MSLLVQRKTLGKPKLSVLFRAALKIYGNGRPLLLNDDKKEFQIIGTTHHLADLNYH